VQAKLKRMPEISELIGLQNSQNSLSKLLQYLQRRVTVFRQNIPSQKASDFFLQKWLKRLADNAWFSRLFMLLIAVNVAAMAIEHDGESQVMQERLAYLNTILVYLFCVEVVVKVCSLCSFLFDSDAC
jgi:hypothetical protein